MQRGAMTGAAPVARTTAHTGGDEGHVAALNVVDDFIEGFLGGCAFRYRGVHRHPGHW